MDPRGKKVVNRLFDPTIKRPNLAAVQTAFTGRLYAWDLMTLYRAISGQYTTYPSVLGGALGLTLQQDVITFIGAIGPFGRFHWVGDVYSVIYNQLIRRDLTPLVVVTPGFWTGWDRFTELLKEDADEVGEPLAFGPVRTFDLPVTLVDVSALPAKDQALYAIYRGDVDSMNILLEMMVRYMPETLVTLPLFLHDLEGIFELYGEWIAERFLTQPASRGARIMSKVILLADYRWYLLAGDLLSMIEPTFLETGFNEGMVDLATLMRLEAEGISVVA